MQHKNASIYVKKTSPKWFEKKRESEFFIPVVIHGSKRYDTHLILKHLKKEYLHSDIKVIASNSQQYISIEFNSFRFLDSNQFLPASLQSLVESLKASHGEFKYTERYFKDTDKVDIMCQKGVFCYNYNTDISIFSETSLPP